jgi:hypothetical protein
MAIVGVKEGKSQDLIRNHAPEQRSVTGLFPPYFF